MPRRRSSSEEIKSFQLPPGRILAGKYEIISRLGRGWEGEVYKLRELSTDIERAGKFFFPQRNLKDKSSRFYSRKLNKLRHVPILIQYHTSEFFTYKGQRVTFLVSEYVEGELLSKYLTRQPGRRLSVFQGLHLLYALAVGMEGIHNAREYHGDLHEGNIIVRRQGIGFHLKLLDFYDYGTAHAHDLHDDVCDLIRIFYDAIGGRQWYSKHPPEVKAICRGLKRSLILRKYRTAGQLRQYLETMSWSS
jgi:serine/threonine protein kinase